MHKKKLDERILYNHLINGANDDSDEDSTKEEAVVAALTI